MMDRVFNIGDTVELVDSDATKLLEKLGFTLNGTICKISSNNTCDIETKDTIYTDVPASVLKVVSEEEGFKSQQELWEYLSVEGNRVISKETGWQYLFIQGRLCRLVDGMSAKEVDVLFTNVHHFIKYQVPVQANWYDNIPEQGVLCWVSDLSPDKKELLCRMKSATISRGGCSWKYVTPVTQEEVDKCIYHPTK